MKAFKRIITVVLDGFGVGELPDANQFGDTGSNTFESLLRAKPQLKLPYLQSIGLWQAAHHSEKKASRGFSTRMNEISAGKDTTTGHWEMMGLPVTKPFDFFPNGFSDDIMNAFVKDNQLPGYLGNTAASGTEIIERLGQEHIHTGKPIVYTSADSVFQIAAHEEYFGLNRLYEICQWTREYFNKNGFVLGRVIARPFMGDSPANFQRTINRKDYSLKPFGDTVLTQLQKANVKTFGVGKIPSIYDGIGIDVSIKTGHDKTGFEKMHELLKSKEAQSGFVFVNLNDLDTLYGHRRNPQGYAEHLEYLDSELPALINELGDDDLILFTSDHGNDPAFKGTDHTREYVPVLIDSPRFEASHHQIPERASFADLGATILENFKAPGLQTGTSFFKDLEVKA